MEHTLIFAQYSHTSTFSTLVDRVVCSSIFTQTHLQRKISSSDLKNISAVANSFFSPKGDDTFWTGAARAIIQPSEQSLTHSGREQRGGGGAQNSLLKVLRDHR